MVDEKIFSDCRTRVDVDSRQAVGMLRHDARDHRHAEQKQLMGDTRGENRVQARIGADDFVLVIGGGVAVIECLNICLDILADLRYFIEKVKGDTLGLFCDRIVVRILVLGRVF